MAKDFFTYCTSIKGEGYVQARVSSKTMVNKFKMGIKICLHVLFSISFDLSWCFSQSRKTTYFDTMTHYGCLLLRVRWLEVNFILISLELQEALQ